MPAQDKDLETLRLLKRSALLRPQDGNCARYGIRENGKTLVG